MSNSSRSDTESPAGSKRKDPPSPSTSEDEDDDPVRRPNWRMDPKESHSDWTIEIVVNGRTHGTYHVHKLFLSAGSKKSEYFEHLFQSDNFSEAQTHTSRIDFEELAAKAFPTMLDYLYSWDDTPSITHENGVPLHFLGRYFEMRLLRKKVRDFWKTDMIDSVAHLGTYYEHAKLFCDEKGYKAVVKVCCEKVKDIKADSQLIAASDAQFWWDVLQENGGTANADLSDAIAVFCLKQASSLDTETFLKLTAVAVLPMISEFAAIPLMQIEKKLLLSTPDCDFSSLQNRCVTKLSSCWHNWNHATLQQIQNSLLDISPIVLSSVLTSSLEQAKARFDATDSELKSLKSRFPRGIEVSGSGVPELNGRFTQNGFHNHAPRYCMAGSYQGAEVEFSLYLYNNGLWFISILAGQDPGPAQVDTDFYANSQCPDGVSSLLPPRTGWKTCVSFGRIIEPPPTLVFVNTTLH